MRYRYEEEMSPYTPLCITCVRSVEEKYNDDIITIRPYMSSAFEQMYSVTHKVGVDHSPEEYQMKTTTDMTTDGLLTYLDSLIDLLYYDEDPFNSIQFDIPSLPSILVKPSNLDLVKDRILSYVKALVNSAVSWPLNDRVTHTIPPTPVDPVHSESEESEVPTKKHKKNKHHKHHKNAKHSNTFCKGSTTCNSEVSRPHLGHPVQHPRNTREHLFFDEDNNISSYYYDL